MFPFKNKQAVLDRTISEVINTAATHLLYSGALRHVYDKKALTVLILQVLRA